MMNSKKELIKPNGEEGLIGEFAAVGSKAVWVKPELVVAGVGDATQLLLNGFFCDATGRGTINIGLGSGSLCV